MKKIIRNHARVAGYLSDDFEDLNYDPLMVEHNLLPDGFSESLKSAWKLAIETGEKFGYRNAQVSVIAPTGTISFAMDCGATSVEPYYSHVVFKQLSGGGTMLIINPVIRATLKRLGYKKNEVENIFAFMLEKDESGTLKNHSLENAPALRPNI